MYIKGSTTAGTSGDASVPNIKGVVGTVINKENYESTYSTLAFKIDTSQEIAGHSGNSDNYLVNMDASCCNNKIFGNFDTVNLKHIEALPIIKTYHL